MDTCASVRMSNGEILLALEHNEEFFINFFLGDSMALPTPEFHPKLLSLMIHEQVQQLCLAIPRGHAKTTLAKLAAVYYLLFTDYQYVLYMSSVAGHSVECVNDIVNYFSSPNFEAVFGNCGVEFFTEQEGKGYYKFKLPSGKICILKAFGAGQKVRGTLIEGIRPQLVIVDDLEDNDNIGTPDLFKKLKRWFYGPFKKCIDKQKHKWIWIGNMIAQESMLYENCVSPFWTSRLFGALLADGTPLWPDMWTLDELRKDFAEYAKNKMADVWFAEMMNMPLALGNGIIKPEDIQYLPEMMPGDYTKGFITVDFAISKESWADSTSLNVHIWRDDLQQWQVVETIHEHGLGPIGTFWHIIKLGQKWHVGFVGLEAVAWQAAAEQIYEHLCLMNGITGFKFVPVPARAAKTERILSWVDMIKSGMYALTEGDFIITRQLLVYDVKKKANDDDAIDSCAQASYMITQHLLDIFEHKMLDLGLQARFETQSLNATSIGV